MNRSSLILLLGLLSCSPGNDRSGATDGWTRVPLRYATRFAVEQRGEERRVTVFGPGGPKDTLEVYRLGGEGTDVVPWPLTRIVVASTTHLAYLHALGALDAVVGAAHMDRLVDSALVEALQGRAQDLGTAMGLDRERLVALSPEAVLDHPFGREGQASEAPGPKRITITEYLEEHPLGRAEWLRFFGVLLGREALADSLFAALEARYEGERSRDREPVPVFFGSAWQARWYAPPGNSYMATLIRDAGGVYALADRTGGENVALDLETVAALASRSAHVGVIMAWDGPVDAMALAGGDPRIASLPAVAQGGFVGNSAKSDLFGKALLEPEVVLRDLRCIFHPSSCSGHVPRYFAPLDQ